MRTRRLRLYVLALSGALLLQGVLGTVVKLREGRADDLVHNALHAITGLLGLAFALAGGVAGAYRFGLGFGGGYASLGVVGWVWTDPFGVLPLGPADHVFHMLVGSATLAVAAWSRPAGAATASAA